MALARAVYCAVEHTRATVVVETGVARGLTSRVILEGLRARGGELWSIDLPPVKEGWHDQWAVAVPQRLRADWHLIRGSSRRNLRRVLASAGKPGIFVHDSLHTPPTVRWECRVAWQALAPGGVMLVDDEDVGTGFRDFLESVIPMWSAVAQHAEKGGSFGIAIKAGTDGTRDGAKA